jgi:hypothetical protein
MNLTKGLPLEDGRVLRLIHVDELNVDMMYQRGLVDSSVERIVRDFDSMALSAIEVGHRKKDGKFYIVDGQNRHAAVKRRRELGQTAPTYMLCLVHLNTTQRQEACLFVKRNTAKTINGNLLFKANLVAEAEDETDIQKFMQAEGFELDFLTGRGRPTNENTSPNGIRSVNDLRFAYKRWPEQLPLALYLLKMAFGNGNAKRVPCELRNGQIVRLLSMFLAESGYCSRASTRTLAGTIKERQISIAEKWSSVRGNGYRRYTEMISWIRANLGGTTMRIAA